jgi:multiple sugar transport system substrate-binding protein
MKTLIPYLATLTLAMSAASPLYAAQVKYMLWDSNQLPAYQQCAADFEKTNPGTTVKITQADWGKYWDTLSAGLKSGSAPDVFTNHLAKYPEFVKNNQLEDLQPLITQDALDVNIYADGLMYVWSRRGRQYGLPKDWDTIAMIVNLELAKKAGVSLDELQNMTWNPSNGGSFETILKKLTVDAKGNNALSPKFDKNNIATYGYQTPTAGGMVGQLEWSHFAVSNGFKFQDAPWENALYYDSPKLVETIAYLASLPVKSLSAPFDPAKTHDDYNAMFVNKQTAILPQGSWMIKHFKDNVKFKHAWVPLPVGPSVRRASMFNGLADSIWAGSKVKPEAWKWVKYLGSAECQNTVASFGVVFPAIKGMPQKAIAVQKQKGVDSSAFLTMAKGKTYLAPMSDNGLQINPIVNKAIETILQGKGEAAATLQAANEKIKLISK